MVFLKFLLYSVHVIVCIFLILVVLLQRGKGADLSVFGGGSTQTAFGARGATTLLHKLTVGFFVAFIVTTLAIAAVQGGGVASTVMDQVNTEAAAESDDGATDSGDQTPAITPAGDPAEDGPAPPAEGNADGATSTEGGAAAENSAEGAPEEGGSN